MRSKRFAAQTVSLAMVAAAALAGCSVDGTAVSTADHSVDINALDTGKYPTAPRPTFGNATADTIGSLELSRLTDYIVAPFEIDPEVTKGIAATKPMGQGREGIADLNIPDIVNVPANDHVLYGFNASATTPTSAIREGNRRQLDNTVLRYDTPESAAAAVKQMGDATLKDGLNAEVHPSGFPGSRVFASSGETAKDSPSLSAYTAHGGWVLYTWYGVAGKDKDLLEPALREAISKQSALIDKFVPTPTKAEAQAKHLPENHQEFDPHHILVYALPGSDPTSSGTVLGARGMALYDSQSPDTLALLTKVGSTANAVDRSTVYRATTSDGAQSIIDSKYNGARTDGRQAVAAPPHLPDVRCYDKDAGDAFAKPSCWIHVGRYAAVVSSTDRKDLYQQAAAQYVILTKADQNAN